MAQLKPALTLALKYEGVWSKTPGDKGGETCYGISRVYWPLWEGWHLVDADVRSSTPIETLKNDNNLHMLVEAFYTEKFWNRIRGNWITSQAISNELLDQAINLGVHQAVKHLQEVLNVLLNPYSIPADDLALDGEFGPYTGEKFTIALGRRGDTIITNMLNAFQAAYYVERIRKNPMSRKFLGWFTRV